MEKIIDLHIHTTYSDGNLTPFEVIDEAVKNRVHTISIADHDSIDAYTRKLFEYAKAKGVNIIPGVEISAKKKGLSVHLLGYNFDINNEELNNKLKLLRNARHDYLHNVGEKLKQIGYILNVEKLSKIDAVTKAHIAQDVVENEDNKELLIKEFGYIPERGEFIEMIMNAGCPAYVEKETISPADAVKLLKRAGAKTILAHPVAYKENKLSTQEVIDLALDANVDGIESYYIYVDRNHETINEIDKWNKVALENKFIKTIGSDFHLDNGTHPIIGLVNEKIDIRPEEIEEIIFNLTGENN